MFISIPEAGSNSVNNESSYSRERHVYCKNCLPVGDLISQEFAPSNFARSKIQNPDQVTRSHQQHPTSTFPQGLYSPAFDGKAKEGLDYVRPFVQTSSCGE